uniref:pyrroline-5-carboxylate reductase n=1 Tax=Anopheles culicifacies TaxID=139723 RepID=A0A182MAJ4_9DIPT
MQLRKTFANPVEQQSRAPKFSIVSSSMEPFSQSWTVSNLQSKITQRSILFIGVVQSNSDQQFTQFLQGVLKGEQVWVSATNLENLRNRWGPLGVTHVTTNNEEIVSAADIVFICVKPQVFPQIAGYIEHAAENRVVNVSDKLFVSIMAGVTLNRLKKYLQSVKHTNLVRAMPNTPMQVGVGCTVFCRLSSTNVTDALYHTVKFMFGSLGLAYEVKESQIDAVTGLAGCGPAYVYEFIEALADGGVKQGIPREMALKLAAQTVMGAAKTVLETGKHPAVLKDEHSSLLACDENDGRVLLIQRLLLGLCLGHDTLTLAQLRHQLSATLRHRSVRIQLQHLLRVGKRVQTAHMPMYFTLGSLQHATDFVRFQQTGQIGIGHDRGRQIVTLLHTRLLLPGAVQIVQLGESRLRPDAQTAYMTAGGQLQQITNGPRRWMRRRLRILPRPARRRCDLYTFCTSAQTLERRKKVTACLVFWNFWMSLETTSGSSESPSMI